MILPEVRLTSCGHPGFTLKLLQRQREAHWRMPAHPRLAVQNDASHSLVVPASLLWLLG